MVYIGERARQAKVGAAAQQIYDKYPQGNYPESYLQDISTDYGTDPEAVRELLHNSTQFYQEPTTYQTKPQDLYEFQIGGRTIRGTKEFVEQKVEEIEKERTERIKETLEKQEEFKKQELKEEALTPVPIKEEYLQDKGFKATTPEEVKPQIKIDYSKIKAEPVDLSPKVGIAKEISQRELGSFWKTSMGDLEKAQKEYQKTNIPVYTNLQRDTSFEYYNLPAVGLLGKYKETKSVGAKIESQIGTRVFKQSVFESGKIAAYTIGTAGIGAGLGIARGIPVIGKVAKVITSKPVVAVVGTVYGASVLQRGIEAVKERSISKGVSLGTEVIGIGAGISMLKGSFKPKVTIRQSGAGIITTKSTTTGTQIRISPLRAKATVEGKQYLIEGTGGGIAKGKKVYGLFTYKVSPKVGVPKTVDIGLKGYTYQTPKGFKGYQLTSTTKGEVAISVIKGKYLVTERNVPTTTRILGKTYKPLPTQTTAKVTVVRKISSEQFKFAGKTIDTTQFPKTRIGKKAQLTLLKNVPKPKTELSPAKQFSKGFVIGVEQAVTSTLPSKPFGFIAPIKFDINKVENTEKLNLEYARERVETPIQPIGYNPSKSFAGSKFQSNFININKISPIPQTNIVSTNISKVSPILSVGVISIQRPQQDSIPTSKINVGKKIEQVVQQTVTPTQRQTLVLSQVTSLSQPQVTIPFEYVYTPPTFYYKKKTPIIATKAFDVFIKRAGTFQRIGSGLPRGRALRLGTTKTAQTLAATFRLVPRGFTEREDIRFTVPKDEFRRYKKKKGARVPQQLTFIQRRRFRLSARPEVAEIQRALKTAR